MEIITLMTPFSSNKRISIQMNTNILQSGSYYSCDIYQDVIETVNVRMSKLLEKGLFSSPSAVKIARKWHDELQKNVDVLTEDEIYPIFYKPLETLEQFRQRILDIL